MVGNADALRARSQIIGRKMNILLAKGCRRGLLQMRDWTSMPMFKSTLSQKLEDVTKALFAGVVSVLTSANFGGRNCSIQETIIYRGEVVVKEGV